MRAADRAMVVPMIEFRTGPTPTWKWGYWLPHIVFPTFRNRLRCGCLGFWAFGWKLEVSWNFKRQSREDAAARGALDERK